MFTIDRLELDCLGVGFASLGLRDLWFGPLVSHAQAIFHIKLQESWLPGRPCSICQEWKTKEYALPADVKNGFVLTEKYLRLDCSPCQPTQTPNPKP